MKNLNKIYHKKKLKINKSKRIYKQKNSYLIKPLKILVPQMIKMNKVTAKSIKT